MKRRQILKLLGLAPPLLMASCGDPKLPSTPTVATGKVIDENNMPIEGVSVRMFGLERRGVSATGTFNTSTLSSKEGDYMLSYVVPRGTDFVQISADGTSTITEQTHDVYVQKDGVYLLLTTLSELHSESYGKTTTFNYQFIKR